MKALCWVLIMVLNVCVSVHSARLLDLFRDDDLMIRGHRSYIGRPVAGPVSYVPGEETKLGADLAMAPGPFGGWEDPNGGPGLNLRQELNEIQQDTVKIQTPGLSSVGTVLDAIQSLDRVVDLSETKQDTIASKGPVGFWFAKKDSEDGLQGVAEGNWIDPMTAKEGLLKDSSDRNSNGYLFEPVAPFGSPNDPVNSILRGNWFGPIAKTKGPLKVSPVSPDSNLLDSTAITQDPPKNPVSNPVNNILEGYWFDPTARTFRPPRFLPNSTPNGYWFDPVTLTIGPSQGILKDPQIGNLGGYWFDPLPAKVPPRVRPGGILFDPVFVTQSPPIKPISKSIDEYLFDPIVVTENVQKDQPNFDPLNLWFKPMAAKLLEEIPNGVQETNILGQGPNAVQGLKINGQVPNSVLGQNIVGKVPTNMTQGENLNKQVPNQVQSATGSRVSPISPNTILGIIVDNKLANIIEQNPNAQGPEGVRQDQNGYQGLSTEMHVITSTQGPIVAEHKDSNPVPILAVGQNMSSAIEPTLILQDSMPMLGPQVA